MSVSGSIARAVRRLLLLALLVLLAAPAAQAAPRCARMEMRVMSYNIRLDLASDGLNAWPYRRNELIGQIEIVRPDIIGLQEVVSNQRRDMAAALPEFEFLGVARDDGKDAGEYSPLAVRKAAFAIVSSGTFWLSPTPDQPSLGWDASYKRIVTWARLKDRRTGIAILVLNTHWDHQGMVARRESAGLMSRWIAQNRRPGEHLLILGDFNAPLSEPSMKSLTDAGVVDTRATARQVLGSETTFNDFRTVAVGDAQAIDHILVDPWWLVLRHATIAQHVNGRVASDHFPVVADLSRAQQAVCP